MVTQKQEVWWATWRWSGWVRTQYTTEEWQEWEAERALAHARRLSLRPSQLDATGYAVWRTASHESHP